MKKKMIIISCVLFMIVGIVVANVAIKSNKKVNAVKDYTTECAGSGSCTVEGTSYTIEAIN